MKAIVTSLIETMTSHCQIPPLAATYHLRRTHCCSREVVDPFSIYRCMNVRMYVSIDLSICLSTFLSMSVMCLVVMGSVI